MNAIVSPRIQLNVRPATAGDLPFIDRMQKQTRRQVGWMPEAQLREKIDAGNVVVAEGVGSGQKAVGSEEQVGGGQWAVVSGEPVGSRQKAVAETSSLPTASCLPPTPSLPTADCPLPTPFLPTAYCLPPTPQPLGYCIAQDRYFKRDDVGVIYQMNVVPEARRSLVAATLLRAVFDRAAYGCRLFCCWCAQDIDANRFWRAMGFVPLAFRSGGRGKKHARVHIFWQRRIRAGDESTPWWFPSQTGGGAIREDRLVLPIPPGIQWDDDMPQLLPEQPATPRERSPAKRADAVKAGIGVGGIGVGGLHFAAPRPSRQEKRDRLKNDPEHVALARELRDRWLEQVNEGGRVLPAEGKYDVSRSLPDKPAPAALMLSAA